MLPAIPEVLQRAHSVLMDSILGSLILRAVRSRALPARNLCATPTAHIPAPQMISLEPAVLPAQPTEGGSQARWPVPQA